MTCREGGWSLRLGVCARTASHRVLGGGGPWAVAGRTEAVLESLALEEGSGPIFYYSNNTALIQDDNKILESLCIKSL